MPPVKSKVDPKKPVAPLGLVIWSPEVNSPPGDRSLALCTKPGNVINCTVFGDGEKIGFVREVVRHIDDPDNPKFVSAGMGYWDFTPSDKALMALLTAE